MGADPLTLGLFALGAGYQGRQTRKAAAEAAAAQGDANALAILSQEQALEDLRSDLAPYSQFGRGAMDTLAQALGIQPAVEDNARRDALARAREDYDAYIRGAQWVPDDMRQIYDAQKRFGFTDEQIFQNLQSGSRGQEFDRMKTLQDFEAEALDRAGLSKTQQFTKPASGSALFNQGAVGTQMNVGQAGGRDMNSILAQAIQERQDFDPTAQPLLARAVQERADFDPLSQPLFAQAMAEQAAYDPSNVLNEKLLQNPLLQALQQDVTRRLTANQAARGKLGSGGTAEELQRRLVPQAIEFGLQLDQLQRQAIADRANLGLTAAGLQEGAITGRERTGTLLNELQRQAIGDRFSAGGVIEDLGQRDISNLYNAAQIGANAAARTGTGALNTGSNIATIQQSTGQSNALGALGQAYGNQQMIGGITSLFAPLLQQRLLGLGGLSGSQAAQMGTGPLIPT